MLRRSGGMHRAHDDDDRHQDRDEEPNQAAVQQDCRWVAVVRASGVTWPRRAETERPRFEAGHREAKEKLRSDPKFALATLQSAGIATPTGKLSKRFKG